MLMEDYNKQDKPQQEQQQTPPVKPDILDYDDIRKMVPFFDGKPKLVKWLFHLLDMDDANWIHGHKHRLHEGSELHHHL